MANADEVDAATELRPWVFLGALIGAAVRCEEPALDLRLGGLIWRQAGLPKRYCRLARRSILRPPPSYITSGFVYLTNCRHMLAP